MTAILERAEQHLVANYDWCEADAIKKEFDTLRTGYASWSSIKGLELRPDLVYTRSTDPVKEIAEELEFNQAVAVVVEDREPSKKVLDLQEKIRMYEEKIVAYRMSMVAALAKRTTKHVKCLQCNSKFSTPHLLAKLTESENYICPMCDSEEFMMSNTSTKRVNALRAYITKYTELLNEAQISGKTRVISKSWLLVGKLEIHNA